MAKTNKKSLRLDADFTEDTVGFAIESFLSVLSFPRYRFSIEPFSRGRERWLGADARLLGRLKGFKPFYMQFKRPSAYPDHSASKIITDRNALSLPVSPKSLFFGLREKQPKHWDYQHNILFRLRRRLLALGVGDATYVCPLFIDRVAYRFHVHISAIRGWPLFWRPDPWSLEKILIHGNGKSIAFDLIPVLNEHVSIPPHKPVSSAKHSYSFTENGSDLCFHSPIVLSEGSRTLAAFLSAVSEGFLQDDGIIHTENAGRVLHEFLFTERDDIPLTPEQFQIGNDGIAAWLDWGNYLRQEYQIEQFALMRWK